MKRALQNYKDPAKPGSLGGVQRFAKANRLDPKKVKTLLETELGYTLHKPRRRRYPTLPVLVFGIDEQWVSDLIEVQNIKKENKGYRYLLTVVDAFSKYAWVEPVKNKTGKAVTEAFETILKRAKGRKPLKLQTDDGKEYYNKTFAELMKRKDIQHFSTSGDTKASIVERFNRTLKERLYRYFTSANTLNYTKVLPALVKGYNLSFHRSIGMAPAKVTLANQNDVWNKLYAKRLKGKKRRSGDFKVGDKVRLNKKFRPFKKSYLPGWTEEVFVVRKVKPGPPLTTYQLEEYDGTPLGGTFYKQDLQKVTVNDDQLFRVDKILKRKGTKVLIDWKGWPVKYRSWIDKKDLVAL